MAKYPMWAVLPLLTPWRGDTRRNPAPYFLTGGFSGADFGFAQYVKNTLQARGIACFVDMVGV